MNLTEKITIPSTVFVQKVDDEMVLLDMNSENYFGLDTIGTVMWHYLSETHSLAKMLSSMLEEYDVEEDVLRKDITTFVQDLEKNALIQIG